MAKSMDEAYRDDYRAKSLFDDAARALIAVINDTEAVLRLHPQTTADAQAMADKFKQLSAGVVRTWD